MCEHVFSIEHVCLAWFQNGIEKEERRKAHTCVTRTAEFAPPSKHVDYISSRNEFQNDVFWSAHAPTADGWRLQHWAFSSGGSADWQSRQSSAPCTPLNWLLCLHHNRYAFKGRLSVEQRWRVRSRLYYRKRFEIYNVSFTTPRDLSVRTFEILKLVHFSW